jgi:hypothetical protein
MTTGLCAVSKGTLDDVCNMFTVYAATPTVFRLKPIGQNLRPFARVTRTAAQGNIFPRDYIRIVNDVFPTSKAAFG